MKKTIISRRNISKYNAQKNIITVVLSKGLSTWDLYLPGFLLNLITIHIIPIKLLSNGL